MLFAAKKSRFLQLFLSVGFLFLFFNLATQKSVKSLSSYTDSTEQVAKHSFFSIENLKETFSPEKSPIYLLILALLIGILTSFTPCVYPMIPITLGILQTQASTSLLKNFMLAVSYVLGISTVYAILGYVAATTTLMFGQWLANPWLIFFVSLFFIYIAFSMFGFYEIKIPSFLTKRDNVKVGGSYLYSFLFGMISGTVASPCLTPAIAILLGFVAKIGSPVLGFLTLFFFSIGMGILLVVIGTFSTSMSVLPKAGMWMIEIKKIFGFVLLGMIIYLADPFLGGFAVYKGYAMLSLIAALYYLIKSKKSKLQMFLGVLFLVITLILTFWIIKEKRLKSHRLLASNLKPDSLVVCLSTAKNQRI